MILKPDEIKSLKLHLGNIQNYIQSFRSQKNHLSERVNFKELHLDETIASQTFVSRLYSQENLTELLIIKSVINTIESERIRKILTLCLLGILRRVSFLSSNFANDYVPRNKNKKSDVLKEFISEYDDILERLIDFSKKASDKIKIRILNEDTRDLSLNNKSVDLIINHPPYISAVPYAEYFKLEMLWLGLVPKELNKKIIGGQRGSNNVVERFNEGMEKTFVEMFRVLKKGKYACVVIGNARVKGKIIESNKDFIEIAKKAGFTFIEDICRNKLDCANAWMKTEHILIFKKE